MYSNEVYVGVEEYLQLLSLQEYAGSLGKEPEDWA